MLTINQIREARTCASQLAELLKRSLRFETIAPGLVKSKLRTEMLAALGRAERVVAAATVELASYSRGGEAHLEQAEKIERRIDRNESR